MSLEIHKMLALSTSHLSERTCNEYLLAATRDLLNGASADSLIVPSVIAYEKRDYGWFVWVPENPADSEGEDIPLELRSAIHVARVHGCGWVMFDRDAPVIDELPHYDW